MNYKMTNLKNGKEVLLSGSFTFRDHDTFFEIISVIKNTDIEKLVFNLKDCDFIDSAALGAN